MDHDRERYSGREAPRDPPPPPPPPPAPLAGDQTLGVLDMFGKRLMIGLALAGALPAIALYAQPQPKHFEAFVANGEVIRVNTRTGTIVACNAERCMQVLERGQKLKEFPEGRLFAPEAPAAPALPSPAGAPAAPEAPEAPTDGPREAL